MQGPATCALAAPREELTLLLFFIVPLRVRLRGLARFLLLSNVALGLLECFAVLPAWLAGGSAVASVPLVVLEPVPLAGVFGRAWDAIRLWIK